MRGTSPPQKGQQQGSSHLRGTSSFQSPPSPHVLGPVATASGMHGGDFEWLGPVTTASDHPAFLRQRQESSRITIMDGYVLYNVLCVNACHEACVP